jgi:hypothetical protein
MFETSNHISKTELNFQNSKIMTQNSSKNDLSKLLKNPKVNEISKKLESFKNVSQTMPYSMINNSGDAINQIFIKKESEANQAYECVTRNSRRVENNHMQANEESISFNLMKRGILADKKSKKKEFNFYKKNDFTSSDDSKANIHEKSINENMRKIYKDRIAVKLEDKFNNNNVEISDSNEKKEPPVMYLRSLSEKKKIEKKYEMELKMIHEVLSEINYYKVKYVEINDLWDEACDLINSHLNSCSKMETLSKYQDLHNIDFTIKPETLKSNLHINRISFIIQKLINENDIIIPSSLYQEYIVFKYYVLKKSEMNFDKEQVTQVIANYLMLEKNLIEKLAKKTQKNELFKNYFDLVEYLIFEVLKEDSQMFKIEENFKIKYLRNKQVGIVRFSVVIDNYLLDYYVNNNVTYFVDKIDVVKRFIKCKYKNKNFIMQKQFKKLRNTHYNVYTRTEKSQKKFLRDFTFVINNLYEYVNMLYKFQNYIITNKIPKEKKEKRGKPIAKRSKAAMGISFDEFVKRKNHDIKYQKRMVFKPDLNDDPSYHNHSKSNNNPIFSKRRQINFQAKVKTFDISKNNSNPKRLKKLVSMKNQPMPKARVLPISDDENEELSDRILKMLKKDKEQFVSEKNDSDGSLEYSPPISNDNSESMIEEDHHYINLEKRNSNQYNLVEKPRVKFEDLAITRKEMVFMNSGINFLKFQYDFDMLEIDDLSKSDKNSLIRLIDYLAKRKNRNAFIIHSFFRSDCKNLKEFYRRLSILIIQLKGVQKKLHDMDLLVPLTEILFKFEKIVDFLKINHFQVVKKNPTEMKKNSASKN